MKAWILDALDGIEKMRLGELPDPKAGANEVVLRMKYAALNPADRYLAQAQYPARPPLPHVLGRDGLGVVEQVGSDVTGHRVGDVRVVLRGEAGVTQRGLFAERVAVNSEWLVTPPAGWTEEESASAPLVYVTAYQALTQWGELQNAVVLVTGASGGVGVASIQLGAALGHTMIGLSRSSEKSKILLDQGASACFQPQDEQWRQKLYDFLGHRRGGVGGGHKVACASAAWRSARTPMPRAEPPGIRSSPRSTAPIAGRGWITPMHSSNYPMPLRDWPRGRWERC
jgi:NADPH2:quinone reductase